MSDSDNIDIGPGGAILLDALGARAIRLEPSNRVGVMLDLEGRLNRQEDRHFGRYLLSAAQAAELMASLVAAIQLVAKEIPEGFDFTTEFESALAREQERWME